MLAEFKHTLSRKRGQIIGWGIGLALYSLMMIAFYPSISGMEDLVAFIEGYPKEMLAFFGNLTAIATPVGYLDTYYYAYMTLIIGILAIGGGASLLVGDEETGILDLVLAHPIHRTSLFWGRLLGFAVALALVLLVGWLAWTAPAGRVGMDLSWIEFLRPFGPLFAVLLLFATLALLLSVILPSARLAGMISGALLVGNFLLMGLSRIDTDLEAIAKWTPLYYYQGGMAATALNWSWLAGLLGAALLLAVPAWLLFLHRDIRVGGEHGWKMPSLRRQNRVAQMPRG